MFDALARLADRRGKRVVLFGVLFFVVAGTLGGSVANRLAPYGADDPSTETVKATNLLEDAGYRSTALVVLVKDAKVSTRATRKRVEGIEGWLRKRPQVASVSGYYDSGSRAFVSHDGDSTYV